MSFLSTPIGSPSCNLTVLNWIGFLYHLEMTKASFILAETETHLKVWKETWMTDDDDDGDVDEEKRGPF